MKILRIGKTLALHLITARWVQFILTFFVVHQWFLFVVPSMNSTSHWTILLKLGSLFMLLYLCWVLRDEYMTSKAYSSLEHLRNYWIRALGFLSISAIIYTFDPATGFFCTAIVAFVWQQSRLRAAEDEEPVITGPPLKTAGEVAAKRQSTAGRFAVPFGNVPLSFKDLTTNMMFLGSVGAGKSLLISLVMQFVFPDRIANGRIRGLVYDASRQYWGLLRGMGVSPSRIRILNPFDRRCARWNLARDITTPTDAENFARIIVPESPGAKEPFWRDMTVISIKGIIRVYINAASKAEIPPAWTLRDVILGLRSEPIMRKILKSDQEIQHYAEKLGSQNTLENIMASILQATDSFEPIAALWEYAATSISLEDWALGKTNTILLLGRATRAQAQMDAINRALITFLGQALMERTERNQSSDKAFDTLIVLDEMGSLGNIDSLKVFASELRKFGVGLVMGFQTFPQLKDSLSAEVASAILGNVGHKAFLRMNEPDSAEWASRNIGKVRKIRISDSVTTSFWGGGSHSRSENTVEEEAIMPSELLSIPPVDPAKGQGVKGLYLSGSDHYWYTYEANDLFKNRLSRPIDTDNNFVPMPKELQILRPWNDDDLDRLGIRKILGSTKVRKPVGSPSDEMRSYYVSRLTDMPPRKTPPGGHTDRDP